MRVYVIYGCTGDTKQAKQISEAIVEAIEEEIAKDPLLPTLMARGFNHTSNELHSVKKLIEEQSWCDLGAVADWWRGIRNQTTCHSRADAKPTRIDGILTNIDAMTMIHSFKVIKHEMIPTHAILEIKISRNAMKRKRTFARTLPCLKKLCEEKAKKGTEEMDDKAKHGT